MNTHLLLLCVDIGPQGIVHGTTLTLLNAGRKYLGSAELAGKVFVTSGLGGMSGAQAKAAVICGAITVIAEVNPSAVNKRHSQGWVIEKYDNLDQVIERVKSARKVCKSQSYCVIPYSIPNRKLSPSVLQIKETLLICGSVL